MTKPPEKARPRSPTGIAGTPESAPAWQVRTLATVRRLVQEADPEAVEEPKWRKPSNPAGIPVWSHDGILLTGESYRSHVRLTFARGASLDDPDRLFNSGFEGKALRAIVLREGEELDPEAFKGLVRAAAAWNRSRTHP